MKYKYYKFGSDDSTDTDVVLVIDKSEMPQHQEDRKNFTNSIKREYNLDWNIVLVVIENNNIVDTIYPKSWIDSIQNALVNTYHLHEQKYPLAISRTKRNTLLSSYKAVRTILSFLSKTEYRPVVKKALNSDCFQTRIDILRDIDISTIDTFKQKNMKDIDILKVYAFYTGQEISLQKGIEIYTKKDLIYHHPELYNHIYRLESDNKILDSKIKEMLSCVPEFEQKDGILYNKKFIVDCKYEMGFFK